AEGQQGESPSPVVGGCFALWPTCGLRARPAGWAIRLASCFFRTVPGGTRPTVPGWRGNRRKGAAVRDRKMLVVVATTLFTTALSHIAMGQDRPTAREVVARVRQAARTLSKTRDLTPFTQKKSPWVWKE